MKKTHGASSQENTKCQMRTIAGQVVLKLFCAFGLAPMSKKRKNTLRGFQTCIHLAPGTDHVRDTAAISLETELPQTVPVFQQQKHPTLGFK